MKSVSAKGQMQIIIISSIIITIIISNKNIFELSFL